MRGGQRCDLTEMGMDVLGEKLYGRKTRVGEVGVRAVCRQSAVCTSAGLHVRVPDTYQAYQVGPGTGTGTDFVALNSKD